jgi:hypothetical protein
MNLTTEEITRRIREAMIYLLECKKEYFANVYAIAAKMARDIFGATVEEAYTIGVDVARDYTITHGKPDHT